MKSLHGVWKTQRSMLDAQIFKSNALTLTCFKVCNRMQLGLRLLYISKLLTYPPLR